MKSHNEEKRIRPDILTVAVLLSAALMMVFEIVTQRIYGDLGAFFTAGPFTVYLLYYLIFVLSVQKAVYIMVRLRARRSQYLNAEANMQRSMRIFGLAAFGTGLLLMALSYVIAERVFGAGRGFIQMIFAGGAVLFLGVQGVYRGYLQGIGYTRPIIIADLLVAIVSFASGTVFSTLQYSYGIRVNNLFHVDEYAAVYGSVGMMAGVLCGSAAGFVQILISYQMRKREITEFVKTGAPRYLDNKNDVLVGIRPIILLYSAPALMVLVDQCFYCIYMRMANPDVDYRIIYGIYSGRIIASCVLFAIICVIPFIKSLNRVMARFERDEYEGARERFRSLMRRANMFFMPMAGFIFALSGTLLVAMFGKSSELADKLMMLGSLLIYLSAFAILFSWLINHMGKSTITMLNVGIGWGVHIVSLIVFFIVLKMGVYGLILSTIVPLIVYDIMCLLEVSKALSNRQEFIRSFVLPVVSSAVAGFIAFLLNRLLVNLIGDVLTLIVCAVIFWFTYMLAMIASRGIRAHELYRIPFGSLFIGIAAMIQSEENIGE